MLINCPRCGFNQPKDAYCAKCGIEIDAYKPPPESLGQKMLRSVPLQLILAVFVIAGTSAYFLEGNPFNKEVSGRQSRTTLRLNPSSSTGIPSDDLSAASKDLLDENTSNEESLEDSNTRSLSSEEGATPAEASLDLLVETPDGTTKRVAVAAAGTKAATTSGEPSATAPSSPQKNRIRVAIYEMQTEFRNYLINLSASRGLFPKDGALPSGVLENASLASGSVGRSSSLIFTESKDLPSDSTSAKFNYGYNPPNGNPFLGLSLEVFQDKSDAKSTTLTLGLSRQWPSNLENRLVLDQPLIFEQSFELSKGNGIFVINLFPAQAIPGEKALLNTNLAKIVGSSAFKSRLTDFVLLIEIDNASN